MVPALILAVGAVAMPLFSTRWVWFAVWSVAALALILLGYQICTAVEHGWDLLACVAVGFIAVFPVAASIAFGFARAIMTRGGTRPVETRKLVIAGTVIYGMAAVLLVVISATG
jgi:hypothetical protein